MLTKDRKHVPLVVWAEMEEAVPSDNAIENTVERQPAHIGDALIPIREFRPVLPIISGESFISPIQNVHSPSSSC